MEKNKQATKKERKKETTPFTCNSLKESNQVNQIISLLSKNQVSDIFAHMSTANSPKRYREEFYSVCTAYFEALRKQGKRDDAFEDEFYYTMPAISGYS